MKIRTIRSLAWFRTGLVLPTVLAGCMNHHDGLVDKCATIPPGAIPQPIGTHVNEVITRQVAKAEMDQFAIYLYEWAGDSANLGPFGSRHIEHLAARLPQVAFPVVIEPDCDPGVNEARRLTVVAFLEQHGIANAAQIVHLGYPQAEGLYGDEAERVYRQMLTPGNVNNLNNQNSFQNGFQNNNLGGVQSGFGGIVR
jgi:hypothetical protein